MEALSSLENANILGRILAHVEDFEGYPQAYANFFKHAAPFRSHITYSGTNTAIDRYMSGAIALGPPASACSPPCVCTPDLLPPPYADQIKSLRDHSRTLRRYQMKPTLIGLCSTKSKRCHKCRQLGHIHRECTQGKKKHFFCSRK